MILNKHGIKTSLVIGQKCKLKMYEKRRVYFFSVIEYGIEELHLIHRNGMICIPFVNLNEQHALFCFNSETVYKSTLSGRVWPRESFLVSRIGRKHSLKTH